MSQSALSNIEREKRSARPATIHRIARALRVPVAAITREPAERWPEPFTLWSVVKGQLVSSLNQTARREKDVSTTQIHSAPNALLTPAEVAAVFRVDPKTVTRWAKAGKLSFIRTLGGHRRYLESEVLAKLATIPDPDDEPLWLARSSPIKGL
jgi:excisionase family DNA binding protein